MSMSGLDPGRTTADNYRDFARLEAAGRSPAYETLANEVAGDDLVLAFVESLPALKRQPNLLFAAARVLLEDVPDITGLRWLVSRRRRDLTSVMLVRRTQTNEVRRCATLLPALALLPGPLSLIEVGSSAGLALLLDRCSYAYDSSEGDSTTIAGLDAQAPLLRCRVMGPVPVPDRVPDVVWRAGLDLNPLEVTDDTDVQWLRCLVWPGQPEREARLLAAVEVARRHPPRVVRGDLATDLPALVCAAPEDSTVVVFHSAVLAYVDSAVRQDFAGLIADLGVRWLSNEAVGVLADVQVPAEHGAPFVLVEGGTVPLAFTHPHGDWIRWIG